MHKFLLLKLSTSEERIAFSTHHSSAEEMFNFKQKQETSFNPLKNMNAKKKNVLSHYADGVCTLILF